MSDRKPWSLPPDSPVDISGNHPMPERQANEQVSCSPNQCVDQSATEGTGPNNADRSEAPLPCRKCGSGETQLIDRGDSDRFAWSFCCECKSCGHRGGYANSFWASEASKNSVERWNAEAGQPPAPSEVEEAEQRQNSAPEGRVDRGL
jgi:hypothetical protein